MEKNNRRDFIKKTGTFIGLGLLGGTAGSFMTGCEQDEVVPLPPPATYDIDITQYPALMSVGGATQVNIALKNEEGELTGDVKNVSIKRESESSFIAIDSLCRHQNCIVNLPTQPGGDLVCPCHNVKFSFEDGSITDVNGISGVPELLVVQIYEFDEANNLLKIII